MSLIPIISILNVTSAPSSGGGSMELITTLPGLGVAGACVAIMVLWQRDTAKQRDKALGAIESLEPLLREVRDILRNGTESQRQQADTLGKLALALERIPSEAEVTRMRDALDRVERHRG